MILENPPLAERRRNTVVLQEICGLEGRIERHGRVPDGPLVGQPFHLHEFQRDIIRSIYGDPRYWQAVGSVLKKKGRAA